MSKDYRVEPPLVPIQLYVLCFIDLDTPIGGTSSGLIKSICVLNKVNIRTTFKYMYQSYLCIFCDRENIYFNLPEILEDQRELLFF